MRDNAADQRLFDVGTGVLEPDPAIMETGRVPLSVYTSKTRFAQERAVFGEIWLNIAETAEVPNAGDWIVREVKIRSVSAIIVRGKDGVIRAFHNICSHRGMKLVWDSKGRGGKFACPYHAWMFDAQGTLVNVPDEGCFAHLNRAESGLTPIACDTWEGFIFINLSAEPRQSLRAFLGPVAERIKDVPFDSYPYAARVGSFIDCNWKLAIEAQCEAYHVRALHARTVSAMLSARDNPYVHPSDNQMLGAHRMQTTPRNPDFAMTESKPVQSFAFRNAAQMVIADTGTSAGPGRNFAQHPDVNRQQSNVWGNDQYVLYPHFIFQLSLGGWWMHRYWPISVDRTYWEAVYHFERPTRARNHFALQYSLALNRDTLMEDNLAVVLQQQVMEGGGRQFVQFGDSEILCAHLAAVGEAIANDYQARTTVAAE